MLKGTQSTFMLDAYIIYASIIMLDGTTSP